MKTSLRIAFFGSSLVSAYWNGAATYYRGIIRTLARRGHRVTFFEPDAFDRQRHRDLADPEWARVVVYPATESAVAKCLDDAREADVVIKASGVGVFDELLEREVPRLRRPGQSVVYWDVDAPATLARLAANADDPLHSSIAKYDLVLTYGGGMPIITAYTHYGARECLPIYNALDPESHFPAPCDPAFQGTLNLLANRLPDRERRIHEFFFGPAAALPDHQFILGGSGWDQNIPTMPNVDFAGHVYTHEHNAFNSSPLAVLNVSRESMASNGYSPATRVFEAAGAAACLITDHWEGVEQFLEPDVEVLTANNGEEVIEHLRRLTLERARSIGAAARRRVLREHCYEHRGAQLESMLSGLGAMSIGASIDRKA